VVPFLQSPPRRAIVVCAVAALAVAVYSHLLGPHLSGPLMAGGDVSIWEYMGYYLSQNLHWLPLPHLELRTDQVFFPYGTTSVFQPWGLERDAFFALVFGALGPGPWVQIYYLLTVFVTVAGAYWLLEEDFGAGRAAMAAALVAFFNFYGTHEYPSHLHICVVHWTTLGILADFVIVTRVVLGRPLSLRLCLLRVALVSLSLGQDLGYVAGFGLVSLTLSAAVLALVTGYRMARGRLSPGGVLAAARRNFAQELRLHPGSTGALGLALVAASFLYVPLALQIAREAKSFDFSRIGGGVWYASPLRILMPFLPWLSPANHPFALSDTTEGFAGGSVGWTFLLPALVGLWCARRRWLVYLPVLLMLGLCLAYRPDTRPTLKIFPWFSFARVGDRATVVYPVLLATLALSARLDGLPRLLRRGLLAAGLALAALEAHTSYGLLPGVQLVVPSRSFFDYMDTIRKQPGQALLDWPFCVTGGNGVGSAQGLCPYYVVNHDDFTYRTYHGKKVVGQYFGRLHPSQLRPFLRAHWERLFVPDDPNIFKAHGQTRCFDQDEWEVFGKFFALNDFAGIQLHRSLLPPSCVEEFYRRYGRPRAELDWVDGDRLAFISRPADLQPRVDLEVGKSFVLRPYYDPAALDLLEIPQPLLVEVEGLSGLEHQGPARWRWGLGPRVSLQFSLRQARPLDLSFTFAYPELPQRVVVLLNGAVLARFGPGPSGTTSSDRLRLAGRPGLNSVDIECEIWNGKDGKWFAPGDARPMSIRFTHLRLE
jgi:hypothetical protein